MWDLIIFIPDHGLSVRPNHLSFRFLTRIRSSLYSPMAAWILLQTSSIKGRFAERSKQLLENMINS